VVEKGMAIRRAISVAARSVILLCLLSLLAADDRGFVQMKRRDFGGSEEQSTKEGMVDEVGGLSHEPA
jgi:hypothetical protein